MELIESYVKNDKFEFRANYPSNFINIENASASMKEHILFLRNKISFFYNDNRIYEINPFSPMMEMADGKRTMTVEDLTDDDIDHLNIILGLTNDPILIGKIHDIFWVLQQDEKFAQKASWEYSQYFKNNKDEKLYSIIMPLKRSLFLLFKIKKQQELIALINSILDLQDYRDNDRKRIVYYYITDFIINYVPKFAKNFITKIEDVFLQTIKNDDVSLDIADFIIKYYKSVGDKENIKKYEFKYVDICKKINEERMPHGYEYLKKAINILDDEYEEELDVLKFQFEDTCAKLHDSFNFVSLPNNQKLVDSLDEAQRQITNQFKSMTSGMQQFLVLLNEFKPMSETSLQKQLENQKGYIGLNLFNNLQFDQNKKLIFESSEASDNGKLEHQISQILQLYNNIMHDLVLRPFILNIILDNELEEILQEIVSHNLFVPIADKDSVYESIVTCLQKNIRRGMFKLVASFENGCREFLKTCGIYPTIKKGGNEVKIDLNHMLVEKIGKKNRFRNAIKEVLGEDLTLEIEYLSCRPLSGNLRNNYYHYGCGDEKEYYPHEMVLFFLLIKAYCLGYDSDINKKDG